MEKRDTNSPPDKDFYFLGFGKEEKVAIRLVLDSQQAIRYARQIEEILQKQKPPMIDGDELKIAFTFGIGYLGGVYERFLRIEELLDDPAVMKNASIESLNSARCLFADLVTKINQIQERFNARQNGLEEAASATNQSDVLRD